METRLAALADAPALAQMHAQCFASAAWSEAQIAASLALPTSLAFAASEGDRLCGFILVQIAGDAAEIMTFCVAADCRRDGVGENLVRAAMGEARRHKAEHIFLEVAADNDAARPLYEKIGFRVTGKRVGYYRRGERMIDALSLALVL